jgi:transcriptional regulator of acetoin/glycerol metabolism
VSRTQTSVVRREIALSWHRSRLAGVDPGRVTELVPQEEYDHASPLLAAAGCALDRLQYDLRGSGYFVLLADRDCRVVHRWLDEPAGTDVFEDLNVRPGAVLREEAVGTNALGTVMETGQGLAVHGEEHWAQALKEFSCYGHPIHHPVTRRLEGVLDVTTVAPRADPLLRALVSRTVADIETQLLEGGRAVERRLLAAYTAAAKRSTPVVALDDDLVMANRAALDLLLPADYGLLRALAQSLRPHADTHLVLPLASGRAVRVTARRVEGTRTGALLHLRPLPRPRYVPGTAVELAPAAQGSVATLVTGPHGSGRTTTARRLAGPAAAVLDAAEVPAGSRARWTRALRAALARADGTVLVENVDELTEPVARLLLRHAASGRPPRLVLTCGPSDAVAAAVLPLLATCVDRVELLPLAERAHEMHDLATRLLRELAPSSTARLTPTVVEALAGHEWPGGLHELRSVMRHVAGRRSVGDVTVADLPPTHRSVAQARTLSGLERAEREAIVRALRSHAGNKRRAAAELGVSRTTLYARIRSLRIADA